MVKVKSSLSNETASYFKIRESVSHLPTLWFRMAHTWCEVLTVSLSPKVRFLFSSVKRAVAATNCRHSGHPLATGSRRWERKATGWRLPPCSCVRTPRAIPLFTLTNKWKGFSKDGRGRTEAPVSTSLRSLNYCIYSWLHSRGSGPSSTSLEYRFLFLMHKNQSKGDNTQSSPKFS